MAATNVNDKFIEAKARLAGKVGAGGVASPSATTIPHTFVGLTDGNVYIVTANRTDATGTVKNPVNSTETFIGKVSSGNFINCVRGVEGTAQAWAADTVLEILFTATGWNKLIEGLEVEHNQDGTHKSNMTLPSSVVTLTDTQTLTNKTLTSPKVGTAINDTNGNELIKVTATASAVNELTLANAATGGSPTLSATGGDSNIDITLTAKGTGRVKGNFGKRIVTASDASSITPNTDNADIVKQVNTQATGTLTINADGGTPVDGQMFMLWVKATNKQTASFNALYVAMGTDLPTEFPAGKNVRVLFQYDSTASKWGCLGVQIQA